MVAAGTTVTVMAVIVFEFARSVADVDNIVILVITRRAAASIQLVSAFSLRHLVALITQIVLTATRRHRRHDVRDLLRKQQYARPHGRRCVMWSTARYS